MIQGFDPVKIHKEVKEAYIFKRLLTFHMIYFHMHIIACPNSFWILSFIKVILLWIHLAFRQEFFNLLFSIYNLNVKAEFQELFHYGLVVPAVVLSIGLSFLHL